MMRGLGWLAVSLALVVAVTVFFLSSRGSPRAAERDFENTRTATAPSNAERASAEIGPRAPTRLGATPADEAASSTPKRVLVRTLDLHGARIADVALFETTDEGSRSVGTSGPGGETELEFGSRVWTALVGRRDGFGPARVSWRGNAPATIELRLPEAGSIAGRVVQDDKRGAPEGLRVLAVPVRMKLAALGRTAAQLASEPEFVATYTDANGAFELEGLAQGEVYALHCGGLGFLAMGEPPYARPGDVGVEIPVARGYGLVFEFADASGAPPCLPEIYGANGRIHMSIHDAQAEFVLNFPPSAGLALGALLPAQSSPTRQVLLLASPVDTASLGPVRIECALPGYLPVDRECFALPLDSGLAQWTERLSRTAQGFGEIHLDLTTFEQALRRSSGRHGPIATIELVPTDNRSTVRVLRHDSPSSLVLDCVPFGRHDVVFVAQPQSELAHLPLGAVIVGEQPVTVKLPSNTLGALAVNARLEDGRDYVGELTIGLGTVPRGSPPNAQTPVTGSETLFRHPPYEFALLPRGDYRVWLSGPGSGSTTADIHVESGGTTAVDLTMHL